MTANMACAAGPPTSTAGALTSNEWTEFSRQFDAEITKDGIVGASAVMLRNGRIAARNDRGLADRDAGQSVDERTLFHWG